MPKKTANIKEILAANLKENRRKRGLTQEKLAELADMSLHYLAIIELGTNFPSGEMLEKLAKALEIQVFELFYPITTLEGTMHHLEKTIIANIEGVIDTAVKQSIYKENQTSKGKLRKGELEQYQEAIMNTINKTINKAIKTSFEEHRQTMVKKIEQTVSKAVVQSVSKTYRQFEQKIGQSEDLPPLRVPIQKP